MLYMPMGSPLIPSISCITPLYVSADSIAEFSGGKILYKKDSKPNNS